MSGAVDFLLADHGATGDGVGVVGFCMGGMLAWLIAVDRADAVRAVVPFYGYPSGDMEPDWSHAGRAGPRAHGRARRLLRARRRACARAEAPGHGQGREITVHAGTGHAFMASHNALGTRDEAKADEIWPSVLAFLHEQLG